MKRIFFLSALCLAMASLFAQATTTDTLKTRADSARHRKNDRRWARLHISDEGEGTLAINDSVKQGGRSTAYPTFSLRPTFARFDLGFATLLDNGSFTLHPQNQFLRYNQAKTSNVGFDVLQFGVRFSKSFKLYLSGGFDWTLIRLRDNITILPDQPLLTYRQDHIDYSKNRFSSSYLRIPLSFELRSQQLHHGKRFHFVFGPEGGFLLNGMVKQISSEYGKQKASDSYNFTTFRYGAFTRIGYGSLGIFAKYYFNDMFENSPQQSGLKDFAFGLMVGF